MSKKPFMDALAELSGSDSESEGSGEKEAQPQPSKKQKAEIDVAKLQEHGYKGGLSVSRNQDRGPRAGPVPLAMPL